jgi:Domain of unknown function (DUF4124)
VIRAVLLLLALLPAAAAAQMYKWVDEKGVTHYSETLPPDAKGAKVDVKPASGDASPRPATDWKQKELDARQQRIQKEQNEQQQQAQEMNQARGRHNNCLQARRELAVMRTPGPVYRLNDKGEKVYFDEAERERQIAGWQANVTKYCD